METETKNSATQDLSFRLFARTDVGQVREHNEDNFLVSDLTTRSRGLLDADRALSLGAQGTLLAVCDGMGGAAAGEIASQMAVDILFERMTSSEGDNRAIRDSLARRLVRAVETAGQQIFQEAKADRSRRGMGTTVTAAAMLDDHLFLAQVGDSRGYIVRGGQLVQVTRDQSLVNQLIEAGQLTEEEAETFEHNNIILQALGTSETVQVDLTFVELKRGDVLMLCSDGLSGMVRPDEIRAILDSGAPPIDMCKQLIDKANQAGGHDNITVIVAQFAGEGFSPPSAEQEPLRYRKYALPDMGAEETVPLNVTATDLKLPAPMVNSQYPEGVPPASMPAMPHSSEDQIEIPGTSVPAWLVVLLVLGVVSILMASAWVLLR
jgi:PPM family protein phosphatase